METLKSISTHIAAILLCLYLPALAPAQDNRGLVVPSERLALVIGNNSYQTAPLKNPVNDAEDMSKVLSSMGFKVFLHTNVDKRALEESIRNFGRQLKSGGVGLFYFSGHGMQVEGRNYLIPVNARIESEADIKYEAVDAGLVLGKIEDCRKSAEHRYSGRLPQQSVFKKLSQCGDGLGAHGCPHRVFDCLFNWAGCGCGRRR